MKKYLLFNLLYFFASLLLAQSWQITHETPMPIRISNNAVAEGFIEDIPYVFSFSGIDSTKLYSGITNRSFKYNTQSKVWTEIETLPDPMAKIAAGASQIGNIIYIIGGYHVFSNLNEESSSKVHRYDVQNDVYLPDGNPIPIAIDDQVQAVWRDSLIYVITGWSDFTNVANVQIYNPSEDSWMPNSFTPNNSSYKAFGASGTIIGDTIYYFGGAIIGSNFPISSRIRKGIINQADPMDIEWSNEIVDNQVSGYRCAATSIGDTLIWLGGAQTTYNFDGIAYNGSGVVAAANRSFEYLPQSGWYTSDFYDNIPMDYRGIANIDANTKYLVGGMESGATVSNLTLRMQRRGNPATNVDEIFELQSTYLIPNPFDNNLQLFGNDAKAIYQILIFDVNGKMLYQNSAIKSAQIMDLSDMPASLYFVKIELEGKVKTFKVIKR